MIDLHSYPIRRQGVVGEVVEDEAVVVLPERGMINVLNEVGARIWELADGARRVTEIVGAICDEYEVEPERAQADALAFLEELVARGAIVLMPSRQETSGAD